MGRAVYLSKGQWERYLSDSQMDRCLRVLLPDRMGALVLATLKSGIDTSDQRHDNGRAVWREFHPVDEQSPVDPSVTEEVLEWKEAHREMVQLLWASPLFDEPLNEQTMMTLVEALDEEVWQEHYCKGRRRAGEFHSLLKQVSTFFGLLCPVPPWVNEQKE